MAQLQRDLVSRDYADICAQVYSSAARGQAGGADCPKFVARRAAGLRDPLIEVRKIEVRGLSARAQVLTRAAGQAPAPETIQFVWENGRFRISTLGG